MYLSISLYHRTYVLHMQTLTVQMSQGKSDFPPQVYPPLALNRVSSSLFEPSTSTAKTYLQ